MAYDSGFSRRSESERDLQPVAIMSVDPASRTAIGITRNRVSITINCAYGTGDTITVPATGEQWYCERFGMEWRLYGRIPFNDATLNIEPEEGQVSVGSASGPLELNGTEVRANGKVFRLNGVYYRDDGETLQRSEDKVVWEPISAQAAGVIQLLGNALAGVPATAGIADYLAKLNEEESDTLVALAEWASGLGDELGGIWDGVCNSPFFSALRDLGDGDSPLDQVVSGFQNFINDLWTSLFCGFTGDLTPQLALTGVQGIADLLSANPFIQGLASLLGENAVGNLLLDAVGGATEFLQQIVNALFCDFGDDLTPQAILTAISGVLQPLIDNPFIQGLATLADTLGTGVGNLFQDAIAGATGLVDSLFRTLFCDFEGDLTPQAIISHIGDLLQPLIDNPFIQGLAALADTLGTGVGNLAADAISGATGLVQAIFGAIFCDFTGDFTPQNMIAKLGEVLTGITTNPFVAGLISFAEGLGHTVGGGIEKAFAGANELLEAIFGIFFCDNEGVPTPQVLVDSIGGLMDFIRTNPLIVGLVEFIEAVGTTSTGFLQKALEGAFTFFNQVVNTLFCNLPGQPTPTQIMASLAGIIGSVTSNPYVAMLRALATHLGDTSTNLIQQLMAGVTGIFDWFIDLLNTFFPLLDWDSLKTLDFPDLMTGLLGDLNPLAFLADGKLNLDWLPQIGIDLIEDLSDYLQTNIVGPIVSGITGGLTATLSGLTSFFTDLGGSASTLIGRIVEHFAGLILGNSAASLSTFFGNLRTLFTGVDFFPTGGPFSMAASASAIITNLLNQATGVSLLDTLIPNLDIDKITNLVQHLTGDVAGNVQTFFANLRNFFTGGLATGGIDFLSGSFNPVTALNTFITTVLSQATATIGDALIPLLDVSKIENLVQALTGQTITGTLSDGLEAVQSFFSGFSGFNPVTGANNLVNQIVERITGSSGVLADLSDFFDGFIGSGSLLDQIANAMTGVGTFATGPLSTIRSLFAGVTTAGGTIIDQVVDSLGDFASSLDIAAMVSKITGISIGGLNADPLVDLDAFFDGFAAFTGGNTLLSQVLTQAGSNIAALVSKMTGIAEGALTDPLGTLDNFFDGFDVFGGLTTSGNTLVNQIVKRILGGDGSLKTLTDLGTFFTNLRSVFGFGGATGALNFSATTAITNLIGGINNSVTQIAKTAIAALDINQISNLVKYITGSDTNSPAVLQTFFAGLSGNPVTATATSLVSQFSKAITGKASGVGSLSEIASFLGIGTGNLLAFDGTNSLISQIVTKVTGDSAFKTLDNLGTFFSNLQSFFGSTINFKTGFAAADAVNKFITDVLNTASTGRISQAILGVIDIGKINNLIFTLTGKADGIAADLGTFFTNLRGMFGGTGALIPAGAFNPVTVANTFITNILSAASNTLTSLIPAHALTAIPIAQISNLISTLTGGGNITEFTNFFTNLRKFLGIGTTAGVFNFLVNPGSFSLPNALNSFFSNVLNQATSFLPGGLIPDLGIEKISNLVSTLTGGSSVADLGTFFTNLRTMLNVGTGAGQINLMVTQTAQTLKEALFGVITGINNTANALITQTGLSSWLGAANLTEIGNFFTNLTKFFKIADFKLAPATFVTNLGTTASKFIEDVLNQATGTLLSPLKVRGVDNTGTLSGDLGARPLQTALTTWLTEIGTTNDIQKFFSNIRSTLGLSAIDFLPVSAFDPAAAKLALHNVISGVNSLQANTVKWATQTVVDGKAAISAIVQAITGATGESTLAAIENLFFGISSMSGSSLLSKFTTAITGGLVPLSEFFGGLTSVATTANSLVHKITSQIIGGSGVKTLTNLGDFFGSFTSTATTLVGKIVDHITSLVAKGLSGMTLENFFSGFNTTATATGSLAYKIAQSVGGSTVTTLTSLENFFANLRSFLGIGTTGISLADFVSAPATFATKLTGIINAFITNVLKKSGVATTLATISDLTVGNISGLVSTLTGSGTSTTDLSNFFTNLRTFLGGAGFLTAPGSFSIATMAENFISTVLQGSGVTTKLVTLASGLNTVAATVIPDLGIEKISNLIGYITGTGTQVGDVQNFFTNLRSLFGVTNFLTASGSFSPATAANQFIVNVLSKATQAGIGSARIAADVLADFSLEKVTNLAKALTGQTLAGASGDLLAVQRFFSGFTGFDVNTGANNLVNQITQAVFGTSGTLAQLQSFFSGFTGFVPGTGANNLVNQITKAITGNTAGVLADISRFLGIGAGNGGLLDFSGANTDTLINQIVKRVTGTGTTLAHLGNIFTNLRSALGFTGLDLHTGALTADTLQTLVFNVIKTFNVGLGNNAFIALTNLQSWLGGGTTLAQVGNFFTNLKTFFGGTVDGSIDLLAAPITFATAVNSFITGILNKGAPGLFSVNLLPSLDITKISNLVGYITGKTTGFANDDLDTFFGNLRKMVKHGTGTGEINLNAVQTVENLQATLFNVITGVNETVGSALAGLVTNNNLATWLGGTTTTQIKTFFDNLKTFLGGTNFLTSTAAFATGLPAVLNNFTKTFIHGNTAKLLNSYLVGIVGTPNGGSFRLAYGTQTTAAITWSATPATLAASIQSALVALTNIGAGGASATVNTTATGGSIVGIDVRIDNLIAPLTLSSNSLTVASGALPVISVAQQTDTAFIPVLDVTKVGNLIKLVTGLDTNTTATLQGFFAGLGNGATVTSGSLLGKIVNNITGGIGVNLDDLKKFADNLKGFLGFNPFGYADLTSTANVTAAFNAFIGKINDATLGTLLLPAKILGQAGAGTTLLTDLTARLKSDDLLTWMTTAAVAGSGDIQKFFSNLKGVLGLNATSLTGTLLTGTPLKDAQAALHGIIRTINADPLIANANKLATQLVVDGKATITTLVEAITGSTGDLTKVTTFFTNLTSFLGFNPFGYTTLTAAANSFFTALNTVIPTTKLDPAKLLQAVPLTQISSLVKFVTGSDTNTAATVQNFFAGLGATGGTISSTSLANLFADAITGRGTGTTPLADIKTFLGIGAAGTTTLFTPYAGTAATTLLSQLVTKITGGTSLNGLSHLQQFFTNIRSLFPNVGLAAGAMNITTAANDLINTVLKSASTANLGGLLTTLEATGVSLAESIAQAVITAIRGVPFVGGGLAAALEGFVSGVVKMTRSTAQSGTSLLADPKVGTPAFWNQTGLAINTDPVLSRSTPQSLRLTSAGSTVRGFDWTVDDLGEVQPIIAREADVFYAECWAYSPTTNADAATITLHGKAVSFSTGAQTTIVPEVQGNETVLTLTRPEEKGTWYRISGYFQMPSGYDGFKAGITLPAGATTAGNQFYFDDLVAQETTRPQSLNNDLTDLANYTISNVVAPQARNPTWVCRYPVADVVYPEYLNARMSVFGTTDGIASGSVTTHTHNLAGSNAYATIPGTACTQYESKGAYITVANSTTMDTMGMIVWRSAATPVSSNSIFMELFKENDGGSLTMVESFDITAQMSTITTGNATAFIEKTITGGLVVQAGERYMVRVRNQSTTAATIFVMGLTSTQVMDNRGNFGITAATTTNATTRAALNAKTSYTAVEASSAQQNGTNTAWGMLAATGAVASNQWFSDQFNRTSLGSLWTTLSSTSYKIEIADGKTRPSGTSLAAGGRQAAIYTRRTASNGQRVDGYIARGTVNGLEIGGGQSGGLLMHCSIGGGQVVHLAVDESGSRIQIGAWNSLSTVASSAIKGAGNWSMYYNESLDRYVVLKNDQPTGLFWNRAGSGLVQVGRDYRFGGILHNRSIESLVFVNASGTIDNWTLRDWTP